MSVINESSPTEQHRVVAAHNDIFLRVFMYNKLSSTLSISDPKRDNQLYSRGYVLANITKEVEGI